MQRVVAVLFFLLLSTLSMAAENNNSDTLNGPKESSFEAANKLLVVMNFKQVYVNAVNSSTNRIIRANGKYIKVEDKIKAFYEKHIGWNSIKTDLANLYAKYYTSQELQDITNFYQTNTGQKVLATMPMLSMEGEKITQKRLRPHFDELKKILNSVTANNNMTQK